MLSTSWFRLFFTGLFGLGAVIATPALMAAANPFRHASRPNIIVIMADDLGWGDIGCNGQNRIRTPNIDRMAAEGMRFTHAYAGNTVCAPSRCTLLTGRHTGRCRVRSNTQVPLQADDITIAEILKTADYHTAIIGKWALGWEGTSGVPTRQGFEDFYGYLEQLDAHNYYPPFLGRNEARHYLDGNENNHRTQYAPDRLLYAATNYVRIHCDYSFFMLYTPTLPHAFNELGTNGMDIPSDAPYSNEPWPKPERGKAAMISRLDSEVGAILEAVHKHKVASDTLVIFTSDNGPHSEGGVHAAFHRSSGPFRGIKRDLYEGGIRVPFIAWWPGKIQAGVTNTTPVALWDLLPTFSQLAGVEPPKDIDGKSIVPALYSIPMDRSNDVLYWEFHERGYQQAARRGDWKILQLKTNQLPELYHLGLDPSETNNVAAANPELTREMLALLKSSADPFIAPTNQAPRPEWLPASTPASRPGATK